MKHSDAANPANFPATTSLGESLALIDSLGSAGLVIAAREPTESMLHAGSAVGGISMQMAEHVYHAMIEAED